MYKYKRVNIRYPNECVICIRFIQIFNAIPDNEFRFTYSLQKSLLFTIDRHNTK